MKNRILIIDHDKETMEKALVNEELILTDSTHVKANASFKKNVQILVERETTDYMERMEASEDALPEPAKRGRSPWNCCRCGGDAWKCK